jgi:hypothetical protein
MNACSAQDELTIQLERGPHSMTGVQAILQDLETPCRRGRPWSRKRGWNMMRCSWLQCHENRPESTDFQTLRENYLLRYCSSILKQNRHPERL